jgi:hypothetical protein
MPILSRVLGSVTNNNRLWIDLNLNQLQHLTVSLLPRTRSILVLLSQFSELYERSHVSSLYNFGKDRTEITTSNSSSIIVCLFVAAEKCLVIRYPATDVLLLRV